MNQVQDTRNYQTPRANKLKQPQKDLTAAGNNPSRYGLQCLRLYQKSLVLFLLGLMSQFLLSSCSQSTQTSNEPNSASLNFAFSDAYFNKMNLDSIHIIWDGPKRLEWGETYNSAPEIHLPLLSPGLDQFVQVELYENDTLRYMGSSMFDVLENSIFQGTIFLTAQFKYIEIEVPIGLSNPLNIAGGVIVVGDTINALEDSLDMAAYPPKWELGPLSINSNYPVSFVLWDVNGDTLFYQLDTMSIDTSSLSLIQYELSSLMTPGTLAIEVEDEQPIFTQMKLAMSNRKTIRSAKEIIISEMMIQPTSTGSGFEFVELFNSTLDTLVLDSCRLTKSRASSATSSVVNIDSLELEPGTFLLLGGDSIVDKDVSLGDFTLTNTRQALLLICGEQAIDSLEYETSPDSLNFWPHAIAQSIHINPSKWENGEDPNSWCSSNNDFELASSQWFRANPYRLETCQP